MNIALGADHAGFRFKDALVSRLRDQGHTVIDLGPSSADSVDYPDFAIAVGRAVAAGEADRGVLVCGTGIGMAMTANKLSGIRAATCNDLYSARMARAHNDANVLTLGERVVGPGVARAIVEIFLETPFEGNRHSQRVGKINALDRP